MSNSLVVLDNCPSYLSNKSNAVSFFYFMHPCLSYLVQVFVITPNW